MTEQPVIELEGVWKIHGPNGAAAMADARAGATKADILQRHGAVLGIADASFAVMRGEVFCIMGLSGSGKSTLLRHINRLVEPTAGRIRVLGQDVLALDSRSLRRLRAERVGMVFQHMALLPHRTVRDNVALGAMLLGRPNDRARAAADQLLIDLEVAHRASAMPAQLSGGEQQRVAIARALINRPPILLADEPTAPLDSGRALAVMDLLERLAAQIGTSVIVVTHDDKIMPRLRRIYEVRGGRVGEP